MGFKTTELKEMMRIPPGKEAQHFQMMGDTGSGKTQLIMQLLRQIRDRGDVAVVYDPAGEFVEKFFDKERGDFILNPLDARCPYWSPSSEMEVNQEATAIASSLYQPTSTSTKDEFLLSRAGQDIRPPIEGTARTRMYSLIGWPTSRNCRIEWPETEYAFFHQPKGRAAGCRCAFLARHDSGKSSAFAARREQHSAMERRRLGEEARGLDIPYVTQE